MSLTKLFLGIFLPIYLLTACGSLFGNRDLEEEVEEVITASVEDSAAPTSNPCLEQWLIKSMKNNIIKSANEAIITKYGYDVVDTSRLNSTDISFSYITPPTNLENGALSCTAQVNIIYKGDNKSSTDLVMTFVKMVNNYYPDPYSDDYQINQELQSLGINEYNIKEFSEIGNNKFSVEVSYEIQTTYSEAGEKQKSYKASLGKASAMLATIALLDTYIQNNETVQNAYQDDEVQAIEDYDDYYADAEQSLSENSYQEKPAQQKTDKSASKAYSSYVEDNDYQPEEYDEDMADEVVVIEEYVDY